jgi:small subunit ribosomal protein S21
MACPVESEVRRAVPGRESEQLTVSEVRIRKGESVDKALRRLKKKLDKEGIMREIRAHRHYEKPSERKRRKMARARIRALQG